MPRNLPRWSFVLLALVVIAIAGFNLWAYNCGYCALQDMKQVGPQVKAVLALILLATGVLLVLALRRKKLSAPTACCQCGRRLLALWGFCPDCGCRRG